MTYQRKIILEELKKLKTHPTADELYMIVKKRIPKISISTVYRSLEAFAECGLIKKMEPIEIQKRFDSTTEHHYHIRCVRCGKLDDLPNNIPGIEKEIGSLEEMIEKFSGYKVMEHSLEFSGICPECRKDLQGEKS